MKPLLFQNWRDLLFLHWRFPTESIQARLPEGLRVHTFEGEAYMAIVPFSMEALRLRGLPTFPGISSFTELNLRTYVVDEQGREGVWFFSLEADSWVSVKIANRFFSLPYMFSTLSRSDSKQVVEYTASANRDPKQVSMCYRFATNNSVAPAAPGTLEHFFVERYRLFAFNSRKHRLLSGTIEHHPYQFAKVQVEEYSTHMFDLNGFDPPQNPPVSALYSPGVDVSLFGLTAV